LVPELRNYDGRFLSGAEMCALWAKGVSDEAIVAMKPSANEDTATYLRVKQVERDMQSKAKGGT
jgi:hypothetical protein